MRDGIVDKGVYARYCNDIILLADWAAVNQLVWFTGRRVQVCPSKMNESRMDGYIEEFT